MDAAQLKNLQAPLKDRYRQDPSTALVQLQSRGELDPSALTCRVDTVRGPVVSGLHPAAGGDGSGACSGDMLLDALVACAGVTLSTVATAMGISLRGGQVLATGVLDFRGTLGVSKDVAIGVREIQIEFRLDTDAPEEQLQKLVQLTERYCVILQTLRQPPTFSVRHAGSCQT